MGHYYDINGKPCHLQPNKKSGGLRDTTITDAKKLGLFPSVTEYCRMLAADGLTNWLIEEAVKAAALAPIQPGENVDEYVAATRAKAKEQVGAAADLGTRIHASLEAFFSTGKAPADDLVGYVEPAIAAVQKMGIKPVAMEMVLVNPAYGYAGTTDMLFEDAAFGLNGVLDFKSKKTKPGEKVFRSFEHRMQIAAYYQAWRGAENEYLIPANATGCNVYISTTEPGRVDVVSYDDSELRAAWDAFKCCLGLYRYTKGYDARVR